MELLRVRDLTVCFREKNSLLEVVKNVSFDIFDGEILGVVGESGSGKSMSALAVAGILPKDAVVQKGEIWFDERQLLSLKKDELRRLQGSQLAMVFQEPMTSLNPVMKIERQVGESLRLHTKLSEHEIHERVLETFQLVGLPEGESLCGKYPHELSGGMRQRVMIAQAMIAKPRLLIADEPTTALDVVVQAQILRLLERINREQHTSVLFISHDLNVVREICSRVIVMYHGQIVERGTVDQVLSCPQHEYTKKLVASIPRHPDASGTGKEILQLKNLNVYYDVNPAAFWKAQEKKHVIQDVSLTAYDGEILGLVGESGCGKSTLCRTILGMNKNFTGEIIMDKAVRPQMVFQDPYSSLNPARKIGWILEEPLKVRGIAGRAERKRQITAMLEAVGLDPSYADRYPRELSGGQRQRVCIGGALLMESRLMIADEPVSALDVTVQSQILDLLIRIHREKKMTILFITHDLNIVRHICRRVAVLYLGEIVEMGEVEEVYGSPSHPYTRLLLASITDGNSKGTELDTAGTIRRQARNFKGCPFYERCGSRTQLCAGQRPMVQTLGGTHTVKCHHCGAGRTAGSGPHRDGDNAGTGTTQGQGQHTDRDHCRIGRNRPGS